MSGALWIATAKATGSGHRGVRENTIQGNRRISVYHPDIVELIGAPSGNSAKDLMTWIHLRKRSICLWKSSS